MIKIGLEVHIHPKTNSKLFCRCKTNSDEPNTAICPICTAQPGTKPLAPNGEAIKKSIILSESLRCKILDKIRFMRKHYFYPDLPAGFQRTSTPIGINGKLAGVRIREVHLEEDAGRYDIKKKTVDFNRAGIPLIEIVTEPDMKSKEEVRAFLKKLIDVLDFLNLWEDKTIRADVNISVDNGKRVEVKEVSTIKGILKVIEIESKKPSKFRVTKHFDELKQITIISREKETEEDYRFIFDPDIPSIKLVPIGNRSYEDIFSEIERTGVSREIVRTILISGLYDFYKKMEKRMNPNEIIEWVPIILGELSYRNISPREFKIPSDFFTIVEKLREEKVTKYQAIEMFRSILDKKKTSVEKLLSKSEIEKVVGNIIRREKKVVRKYLEGKKGILNYLVGQVMKETNGRTSPGLVIKLLKEKLQKDKKKPINF